jgi:hypothetical protein
MATDFPCLQSEYSYLCDTFGEFSSEVVNWVVNAPPFSVCNLPDGHDGPHEFVGGGEIVIVFNSGSVSP